MSNNYIKGLSERRDPCRICFRFKAIFNNPMKE